MTTSAQNPALDSELSNLKRRVSDLERALGDRSRSERPDTTFVLAGVLYELLFPLYPVPQRRAYWEAEVRLGTASSSGPVVVDVIANTVVVLTISVPAGTTSVSLPIELAVARNSSLTIEVTDPGTDAEDLTVCLRT